MVKKKNDNQKVCLQNIRIKGFKSIRELDLELKSLNVLIGANGSGKSNFLSIFTLLRYLAENKLNKYIHTKGGAYAFLNFTSGHDQIKIELEFNDFKYLCTLDPQSGDDLYLSEEKIIRDESEIDLSEYADLESGLVKLARKNANVELIHDTLRKSRVYHFYDSKAFKNMTSKRDYYPLEENARNLAAVLDKIFEEDSKCYNQIIEIVKIIAPFFEGFDFSIDQYEKTDKNLLFKWRHRDCLEDLQIDQMSDGLLRFICLATLLLQPYPPPLILIDEPELGLHPHAIHVLAGMLRTASSKSKIIVATQSVTLVNQFKVNDIIIVEREGDESKFRREEPEKVKSWLEEFEEYGMGDLWEKNIIGGSM